MNYVEVLMDPLHIVFSYQCLEPTYVAHQQYECKMRMLETLQYFKNVRSNFLFSICNLNRSKLRISSTFSLPYKEKIWYFRHFLIWIMLKFFQIHRTKFFFIDISIQHMCLIKRMNVIWECLSLYNIIKRKYQTFLSLSTI